MFYDNTNYYYKKKLGQHFLLDKFIIQKIIKTINPKKNDCLIEIGPGFGAITKIICKLVKKMAVIEIDNQLVNILKKNIFCKLNIFCTDVLYFNFVNFAQKKNKKIRIFGNIPYNISTRLILLLIKSINYIKDIHLMLQEELAEKLISTQGSKKYSRISILTQYFFKVIKIFPVIKKYFVPKPKVNSVFVKITPNIKKKHMLKNFKIFKKIITLAFIQRRKMLSNSLSSLIKKKDFKKIGINFKLRANDLSIKEYCDISNFLSKKIIIKKGKIINI
ncbi:16S rRNA (adenine(1518)-N(6)/adenine(1519)-N(6))-dimethyltransferase RsmA [Buchnera aphidicola (Taiwanaphis decaspermi)]|uniref:16S rRNA (adenine(1518)-N(6)/adenine(1519)-N(6))- dimethyltransferase RsmA n=1 Tax=Buchnera aphidicola TaxID=9 RepID=UPI0031B83080